MIDDITFDTDTLHYYQEHYTGHDSPCQGIHKDLIALWGLRLLEYQDTFRNMPGFPDRIHDDFLIFDTAGLVDDLEESYDIKGMRKEIKSSLRTYQQYPVQIDPEIFSIFLSIKEGFNLSDDETKLYIFLEELEENEGLIDICKCHGELNPDESVINIEIISLLNVNHLREILAPRTDLDIFGLVSFNQEGEMTLQQRCEQVDVINLVMRRTISDDPARENHQIMQ